MRVHFIVFAIISAHILSKFDEICHSAFHQTQSQLIVQFKQKNTRTTLEHSPPLVINTNPPGMRKNILDVNFLAFFSLIVHLAIFTSKPNLVVTTLPLT